MSKILIITEDEQLKRKVLFALTSIAEHGNDKSVKDAFKGIYGGDVVVDPDQIKRHNQNLGYVPPFPDISVAQMEDSLKEAKGRILNLIPNAKLRDDKRYSDCFIANFPTCIVSVAASDKEIPIRTAPLRFRREFTLLALCEHPELMELGYGMAFSDTVEPEISIKGIYFSADPYSDSPIYVPVENMRAIEHELTPGIVSTPVFKLAQERMVTSRLDFTAEVQFNWDTLDIFGQKSEYLKNLNPKDTAGTTMTVDLMGRLDPLTSQFSLFENILNRTDENRYLRDICRPIGFEFDGKRRPGKNPLD